MSIEFLTNLAAVAGVCIVAVNIIVEVLKSIWLKAETSRPLAVVVVSEIVVFFVVYAYCVLENASFSLMLGAGTFFGGFFVAYGAMFGYEKLYGELIKSLEKFLTRN
ncbi:MAG: hypothetical protein IJ297_06150 [Clostridia bacterium]|nr:hypothetical protein [Clostridia bacterium]